MKNLFKQKSLKVCAISIVVSGMALVGYNAYSNATMTPEERLFQQNLEALTSVEDEGVAVQPCQIRGWGSTGQGWYLECNTSTTVGMLYDCPATSTYMTASSSSLCVKK